MSEVHREDHLESLCSRFGKGDRVTQRDGANEAAEIGTVQTIA